MNIRYPTLQHGLQVIRHIAPKSVETIIDIGVQRRTDFLMEVFPDRHHHLFEPATVYHADLLRNYNERNISHTLHKVALSDEEGTLYLHNTSLDGSGLITHSQISPKRNDSMNELVNIEEIPTRTLDAFFPDRALPALTYLIKLDVDGVEEKIIGGGPRVIGNASFVVIETSIGRRDLCSRAALVEKHGFRLFDICDNAYYFGQLALVDLVLINNQLRADEIKFRPWEFTNGRVVWKKWQHGFNAVIKDPYIDPYA